MHHHVLLSACSCVRCTVLSSSDRPYVLSFVLFGSVAFAFARARRRCVLTGSAGSFCDCGGGRRTCCVWWVAHCCLLTLLLQQQACRRRRSFWVRARCCLPLVLLVVEERVAVDAWACADVRMRHAVGGCPCHGVVLGVMLRRGPPVINCNEVGVAACRPLIGLDRPGGSRGVEVRRDGLRRRMSPCTCHCVDAVYHVCVSFVQTTPSLRDQVVDLSRAIVIISTCVGAEAACQRRGPAISAHRARRQRPWVWLGDWLVHDCFSL